MRARHMCELVGQRNKPAHCSWHVARRQVAFCSETKGACLKQVCFRSLLSFSVLLTRRCIGAFNSLGIHRTAGKIYRARLYAWQRRHYTKRLKLHARVLARDNTTLMLSPTKSCLILQPCELVAILLIAFDGRATFPNQDVLFVQPLTSVSPRPEAVLQDARWHFLEVRVDRPASRLGASIRRTTDLPDPDAIRRQTRTTRVIADRFHT